MVKRTEEFREGFILKVGLAWSLNRSHEHDSSKRGDSTGAEREFTWCVKQMESMLRDTYRRAKRVF